MENAGLNPPELDGVIRKLVGVKLTVGVPEILAVFGSNVKPAGNAGEIKYFKGLFLHGALGQQ
jgi:hypothetical protein